MGVPVRYTIATIQGRAFTRRAGATIRQLATRDILQGVSRRAILAAGLGLIAVLLVATAIVLVVLRAESLQQAGGHLGNLATALGEQTRQSVEAIELLVKATAHDLKERSAAGQRRPDAQLHERMRDRMQTLADVRSMAFFDPRGNAVLHTSAFPAPPLNYGDREYIRAHLEGRIEGLHVGTPVIGRLVPEWLNVFSYRVEDAQGRMLGVVAAAVAVPRLQKLYASLNLGADGRVFLVRADGVLLAMHPPADGVIGRSFAGHTLIAKAAARPAPAVHLGTGLVDDKPRLIASQALRDYPVVIAVSSTLDHILSAWRRDAWRIGGGAGAITAILGAALFFLLRQRRIEEELAGEVRESETRWRAAMEAAGHGVWDWNVKSGEIYRSPHYHALLGYRDGEIPAGNEGWLQLLHPDDRKRSHQANRECVVGAKDSFSAELRLRCKNGDWKWVLNRGTVVGRDEKGGARRVLGTITDLSEHHYAEQRIRQTEAQLAAERGALRRLNEASSRLWHTQSLGEGLEEMLDATIELLEADMGNVQVLDAERQVLVIAAQRGFRQDFLDFFREVSAGDDSACGRALRSGGRIVIDDVEADAPYAPLRAMARAAGYRAVQSTPLIARNGAPLGMISTHWRLPHRPDDGAQRLLDLYARRAADYIESMRAEAALQTALRERSEAGERLNGILQSAMDAIIAVDERQRIVMFNAAAEKVFRCPAKEAIGGQLERFIPERFRAAHRVHIEQFGRTGVTTRMMGARLDLWGLRADGEEFPIDASISQIVVGGSRFYTVILRDITERKRAETNLQRSHQELRALSASMNEVREAERARIARELHDELAQSLTALKMDVSWLSNRLPPEDGRARTKVERMKGLVDSTVTSVRRLAHDLRPAMLDDLGLVPAIEHLLHEFSERTGIVVELDADANAVEFREPLTTSVYRMVQEALTNVARHAHATEVRVTIRADGDDLVVSACDNGIGIAPAKLQGGKSLGILGIKERARTLGGAAEIYTVREGGTTVEIRVPVARYRGAGERA
jgi:two-component system sensor kinase